MHPILAGMLGAFVMLVMGTAVYFVVVPYLQLQAKRRQSWGHVPQPGEIWIQDGDLIYIEAVGPVGVEIMAVDGETRLVSKWRDTWEEWQRRLHTNTIWFTGQSRPLVAPE